MKIVVQRSLESSVKVNNEIVGKIDKGLVLLVGIEINDTIENIDYLVKKIIQLRIFDDDKGIMNKSVKDIGGKILSVSQFTLCAETKKGNRPSYKNAMSFEKAKEFYDLFNEKIRKMGIEVATGKYGSDMKVSITNDGPITIILESR